MRSSGGKPPFSHPGTSQTCHSRIGKFPQSSTSSGVFLRFVSLRSEKECSCSQGGCRARQGQAAVTTKRDELKMPASLDANQSLGRGRREFQTLTLPTQRVRHPERQNRPSAVT